MILLSWSCELQLQHLHHYFSGSIHSDSDEDAFVERSTDLLPLDEFKPRRIVGEHELLAAVAEALSRLHFWSTLFPGGVAYTPQPPIQTDLPCNQIVVLPTNRQFKFTLNINPSLFLSV